jgi:hypothetical protein
VGTDFRGTSQVALRRRGALKPEKIQKEKDWSRQAQQRVSAEPFVRWWEGSITVDVTRLEIELE